MADDVRDAAYWERARQEMNAFHAARKAEFDQLEREKQELRARRKAAEEAQGGHVVDIRWSSVAVPRTSGAGGYTMTVAAQRPRRRRRRWF